MFDRLKKFFAAFYSDKPDMLMPAVKGQTHDEDFTAEQQRAAALKYQQKGLPADDASVDDTVLPPPGATG
jgi:hypothetical protein